MPDVALMKIEKIGRAKQRRKDSDRIPPVITCTFSGGEMVQTGKSSQPIAAYGNTAAEERKIAWQLCPVAILQHNFFAHTDKPKRSKAFLNFADGLVQLL